MLKFITVFLLSGLLGHAFATDLNEPKQTTNGSVLAYFHKLLPTTTINKVYTTPYPDTYALVIGSNLVYGNLHSSYLISGHMFNVYNQMDVTEVIQKLNIPKLDLSKISVSDAVVLKASKKVNKKLIIFVDPDCPYCKQLEREIVNQKISAKADIYYMLMPLSIHPNAKQHAANILCSKDPIATLKDYMVNNLQNPKVKLTPGCNIEPILERTGSLARNYGINAVPVIVTGTGETIMGSDINAIQDYLAK